MSTTGREPVGKDATRLSEKERSASLGVGAKEHAEAMDRRLTRCPVTSGHARVANRLQKFSLPSGDDVLLHEQVLKPFVISRGSWLTWVYFLRKAGSLKDVGARERKIHRNRSSVCTILPATSLRAAACRRSTTGTSELGLVLLSGGNSPSTSSRLSCDASFAVSLNAVRERTDLRREEAGETRNNRPFLLLHVIHNFFIHD